MTTDRAGAAAPALRRVHTADLSGSDRAAVRSLLLEAFDSDFDDDDWDHALGGLHVIASLGGDVVGHASLVQRQLMVGVQVHRVGYVEAVAVSPRHRRLGLGDAVMASVEHAVRTAYDFGALSATDAGAQLYRSHGWRAWQGRLFAQRPDGATATPDDQGSVMVFGEPVIAGTIDLGADLTADHRRGEPW